MQHDTYYIYYNKIDFRYCKLTYNSYFKMRDEKSYVKGASMQDLTTMNV